MNDPYAELGLPTDATDEQIRRRYLELVRQNPPEQNPERFAAHVGELRRAVRDNPTEPALEFLLGYELWFGGERAEAVRLFRSAAKRGKDGAIVERFLREAEKPR